MHYTFCHYLYYFFILLKMFSSQLRVCINVCCGRIVEKKLKLQHLTPSLLSGFPIQSPKEKSLNNCSKLQLQDANCDQ